MNTQNKTTNGSRIYSSLFCGPQVEVTQSQQAELDVIDAAFVPTLAAMTEDEKIAEFNRIMGR